jgi:ubiquinone/menaquinone biosynthesis C-methylase UbiE
VRRAAHLVQRAVGLDLSPAMVARAGELAKGIPNAEFRQGESERLPFADGEFTTLLCTTSFHHYPNPEQAVSEMSRVLSPEGRVVIGDVSADRLVVRLVDRLLPYLEPGHVRIHRSAEIKRFLTDAGFIEPTVVRRLWRDSYVIVTARKDRSSPT